MQPETGAAAHWPGVSCRASPRNGGSEPQHLTAGHLWLKPSSPGVMVSEVSLGVRAKSSRYTQSQGSWNHFHSWMNFDYVSTRSSSNWREPLSCDSSDQWHLDKWEACLVISLLLMSYWLIKGKKAGTTREACGVQHSQDALENLRGGHITQTDLKH